MTVTCEDFRAVSVICSLLSKCRIYAERGLRVGLAGAGGWGSSSTPREASRAFVMRYGMVG